MPFKQPPQDGVGPTSEQFLGQRRAKGFGLRHRAAHFAGDNVATVGFTDQTAQPELSAIQQRVTRDGDLTAALQADVERPFRRDPDMSGGIVECGDQFPRPRVVQPAFDPDSALADGRQAGFRLQRQSDAVFQSQPLQASGGEEDGVELAGVQPGQPAADVAAQAANLPAGITGRQLALPAQAGGADPGVGGQSVGVGVTARNEGIARVFARQDHRQIQSSGKIHWYVLHRMYGKIGAAFQQALFQFLDEQPLAAHLGQGTVENSVATGDHADQFDPQARMRLAQAVGDVFSLPKGERAFASGDAERVGVHGFVKLWRPFNRKEYPMSDKQTNQSWGGRFTESTDAFVAAFTASVDFDRRMYRQDINGSIAHAQMLARVGALSPEDCEAIVRGLEEIRAEIERGEFAWSVALEDVHMNIEARLTERIGDAGKRLHTGRSRNDQVATDIRLYLRDAIDAIAGEIRRLLGGLTELATREAETIMPGFTHLQVAQPVTFGHHLLAWFEMLKRDDERLMDCRKRVNIMPLGAAALAGTSYPLDRHYTAQLLDFAAPCANSLDAVSDRDFAIEFTAAAAILMTHLSRMAEELVLWSSAQFDFVDLPDRFCTGSSIMPQKKNPDVPELVRGKVGRVNGHLIALLTLMKSQPLAYNKDNQEDKEPLFDTVDTVQGCLRAFADLIPALHPKRGNMLQAARRGFATATDLADYLVRKGVPFRDAHEIVGKAVRCGVETGRDLVDMTLDELQEFSPLIEFDVFKVLSLEGSVAARAVVGGTAPDRVREAAAAARAWLAESP